jgi:ABC-type nitrate/sulfonate/bicarbonate transport system substrate-binding protein
MIRRRVFVQRVLAPSVALLAAACAQAAPPPPTAAPAAAPKPTTAPAAATGPTTGTAAAPTTAASAAQSTALAATATAPAAAAKPTTAPAVAATPTRPATLTKVTMSFSDRSASDLAIFLAKSLDLFGKYGVDVDLQFVASNTGIPALISDQTQFALIGGPETLGANVEGADLVIVLQNSGSQPYVMEASSSIKTIDDLKGKKIGISTLGSSSDTATRIALRAKGLNSETDVQIVAVGSLQNRMSAMLNGAVDAGLASPPDTLQLEDGGMHQLFDLSTIDMPPLAQCLVTKRSTINTQHDLVQRVVNAVVEATAIQKKDKAASEKALVDWADMTDQRVLDLAYDYWTNHVLRVPPSLKPSDFQGFLDDLSQRNDKAKGFDFTKMLDNSFVDTAVAQGLAS